MGWISVRRNARFAAQLVKRIDLDGHSWNNPIVYSWVEYVKMHMTEGLQKEVSSMQYAVGSGFTQHQHRTPSPSRRTAGAMCVLRDTQCGASEAPRTQEKQVIPVSRHTCIARTQCGASETQRTPRNPSQILCGSARGSLFLTLWALRENILYWVCHPID